MTNIKLPASGLAADVLGAYEEKTRDAHLVTFTLGETYGVPIGQVQEIVRVMAITRVPNTPAHMEGVINLRGRVLPVLNLRRRLGLPGQPVTKASRIIVTEIGSKVVGLLVDGVSHVIKVEAALVEPPPEEVLEVDTDYLTGVCKLKDRLVIILDLERLLKRERIEVPEEARDGTED
jgi:purine-binding chemotaxis protein CheW